MGSVKQSIFNLAKAAGHDISKLSKDEQNKLADIVENACLDIVMDTKAAAEGEYQITPPTQGLTSSAKPPTQGSEVSVNPPVMGESSNPPPKPKIDPRIKNIGNGQIYDMRQIGQPTATVPGTIAKQPNVGGTGY